jgi:gas vesicle protein
MSNNPTTHKASLGASKSPKSSGFGAALIGAAVGAAAGAVAVAMTDERKRKKLKVEFNKAVKSGSKTMDELKKEAMDLSEKAQEAVSQKVEELQKEVAQRLGETTKPAKKISRVSKKR